MTYEQKHLPPKLPKMEDIEIRIQTKEAGIRKGINELFVEVSEKLKEHIRSYRDRAVLLKKKKRGNELILEYRVIRGRALTRTGKPKNPYK